MKKIIPFSKYRYLAFSFSICVMLIGIVFFFINGVNLGIDFTGGITIQIQFSKAGVDIATFRKFCQSNGFGSNITQLGGADSQHYVVRLPAVGDTNLNNQKIEDFKAACEASFSPSDYTILSANLVGSSSSSKLSISSIILLIVVLSLILLYTFIRFKEIKYSFGATLSIIHDALFVLSIIIIFKIELNSQSLAAILTLLGYSINDSIVVLSKIKENEFQYITSNLSKDLKRKIAKEYQQSNTKMITSFMQNIDNSITVTLSRTIITGSTTLVMTICLWLFGGIPTRDFAFILSIGIIIGTYSSIFIAAPALLFWGNPKYDQ
jgi:preprotein translocase SecF subunit